MKKLVYSMCMALMFATSMQVLAVPIGDVSPVDSQKIEKLKFDAEMLRGERHFYIRNAIKSIPNVFLMTVIKSLMKLDPNKSNVKTLGKDIVLSFAKGTITSISSGALWNGFERRATNEALTAQLKKSYSVDSDFSSLPIDQAMLFLAAYKKDDAALQHLMLQQGSFYERKKVKNTVAALYCTEHPTGLMGGLLQYMNKKTKRG